MHVQEVSTVHAKWVDGRWWIPAAAVATCAAVLLGAMVGPAGPTWWRVPLALFDRLPLVSLDSGVTPREWTIIWQIRMPRVVLAALVGATLSLSGASYQGVFRNPLVDPYLLGVAAGAGLGATIVFTVNRAGSSSWIIDPLLDKVQRRFGCSCVIKRLAEIEVVSSQYIASSRADDTVNKVSFTVVDRNTHVFYQVQIKA